MQIKPLLFAVFSMSFVANHAAAAPIRRANTPWLAISKSKPSPVVSAPVAKPVIAPTAYVPVAPAPAQVAAETEGENRAGMRIVQRALDYQGTRYRYGGTTESGLDCSGLIQRVVKDLKFKGTLPRNSRALYKVGSKVAFSELRPGDLVFFKNTDRRGISHVGIYVGKNRFVHASPSHGVTVTMLDLPYYQLRYAGARRMI